MYLCKNRFIKFLSFLLVFAFVFETTNVPVHAAAGLPKAIKNAYIDTLDLRAEMGDISELCAKRVDSEEVFKEYYMALEAYEEDEDNAMYGTIYSKPTKSKQKTTTRYGTPVNFLEYNVVGFMSDHGERDIEVYKCKGTMWFKKVSGEYVITKAKRSVRLIDNYMEDINDYDTLEMLTELIEEFISTDYGEDDYEEVELQVTECPATSYQNTATISGKVSYDDEGEQYPKVTINGESLKVDSYFGTWTKKVTLKEGANKFTIVATDHTGANDIITKTITYKIDNPTLIINKCPESSKTSSVTIAGSVSNKNDKYIKVYINGEAINVDYNGNWSKDVVLKEGNNSFEIKATNSAGRTTIINKIVTLSSEVPKLTIFSWPDTSSSSSVSISGYVSDNNDKKPKVYINDELINIDYINFWSKTLTLKEGVNTFVIKAVNNLGKITTVTKTITFKGGTPNLIINHCPDTSNSKNVVISGKVTDMNDNSPKIYINDELISLNWSNSWTKEVTLKEGNNTFTIKAVNKFGLVTTIVKNITFSVGTPELIITTCPESSNVGKVTISGKVTDANDSVPKVYINDELLSLNSNTNWSKEVTLKEGANTFTLKATNSLGKTTTITKTINFIVEAPSIFLSSFPETSTTKSVTIYGSVSDKNDSATKLYINGEQVSLTWGNWSKTITLVEGENPFEIKAVNSYGKTTILTKKITFEVSTPKLDVLVCPETVNTDKVTISGKVSDSKDSNLAVYINNELINVVNGEWSKQLTLVSGANTITMKATNSGGKEAVITKTITYVPAP